jgi:hypothetical protein
MASGGRGAGSGRDEERGRGRTPERAGLGASSRSSLSRGEQGRRRWERPGRGTLARPDAGAGCARRWPRATARRPSCVGAPVGTPSPYARAEQAPGGEVQGSCSSRGVECRCG